MDEAKSDPELLQTRAELLAALKAGQPEAVMRFVSTRVVFQSVSEPGAQGWATVRSVLTANRDLPGFPDASTNEFWGGLRSALSLGGAFTTTRGAALGRREFCAPYVFAAMPEHHKLPESVQGEVAPWALIRENVEVRARPTASSRSITTLSYALLQAPGAAHTDPATGRVWQAVDLPDGKEGFVPADAIWNPQRYQVCFAKIDERWLVSKLNSHGSLS